MSYQSIQYRAIAILSSIFALRMLGLFMILPVFSIYATQLKSVTPTLVGMALGIYGLSQAIFQIPFGMLSDRLGRKPLIIFGLLLLTLGSIIAATTESIYGIILGRGLQGMGAIGAVVMALISELTVEKMRIRAMAIMGITIGLSFALAMVLGPLLSRWVGVSGLFWLTALFALVAISVLIVWVPTPDTHIQNEDVFFQKNILKNSNFLCLIFGVLVLHASLTALFLKIPSFLTLLGLNFNQSETPWFYAGLFLASLLTTMPIIMLMERRTYLKSILSVAVLGLLFSELSLIYTFNSLLGLSLSLWMFFTAFNVLEASLPALVAKYAPPKNKGAALGIYSSSQFLGLFLGGAIGGWLNEHYGMLILLLFCVIMTLIWFIWILQFFKTSEVIQWQEV